MIQTEYLRRNLECAKAAGIHANANAAISRLLKMKKPPVWMLSAMEGIRERSQGLTIELFRWRDAAEDAPAYVKAKVGAPRDTAVGGIEC